MEEEKIKQEFLSEEKGVFSEGREDMSKTRESP